MIVLFACTGHPNKSQKIIGKWVGTKSTKISFGDTIHSNNIIQNIFLEDSVMVGFVEEDDFNIYAYSFFSDSLFINGEGIKIIKLTDSILVYQREVLMPKNYEIRHFKKVKGMEW